MRANIIKNNQNNEYAFSIVVGIDATNLRSGGGLTHIIELLNAMEPKNFGIKKVIIWAGEQTVSKLPDRSWLQKVSPIPLNKGLMRRIWWQRFELSAAATDAGCSVLFVPGGSYVGSFKPVVAMSQNLLPFEWRELRRYGFASLTFKFILLRFAQSRTFRKAAGVIFLTEWARRAVLKVTGEIYGKTTTIPHGLNPRFKFSTKPQREISEYSKSEPFRLLYVSNIDQYKHQWNVVEAVYALRAKGLPVILDLVGAAYPPALARLRAVLGRLDPDSSWVKYRGIIPYETLHLMYETADVGIFASSCENLPNILIETMAAGLPVACSNRGPMPEVLGDAGLYFDPESPYEIAEAIRQYSLSPELRAKMGKKSFERAALFCWTRCAHETLAFLTNVAHRGSN